MFENIKEFFLKQSIHKQISFGIFITNSFVCILVLTLISINAYIILSINYHNLVYIIDSKEDAFIDSAAIFVDIETYLVIEGTKEPLSWTRNLVEILQKNKDFVNNLNTKINYESKLVPFEGISKSSYCKKEYSDCIALRQYSISPKFDIEGYEVLKKSMFWMIPFFQEVFNFRTFRASDSPLYYKLSLYSRKFNCIFFYPTVDAGYTTTSYFNANFTENTFKKMLINYKLSVQERFLLARAISYVNVNTEDIYNTILNNPNSKFVASVLEQKPFDFNPSLNLGVSISTLNMKYNENLKPLLNFTNIGNETFRSVDENLMFMDDVLIGDWSGLSLDQFTFDLTTQFEGFNLIAANPQNDYSFSMLNCLLQSIEFELLNNLTNHSKDKRRVIGRNISASYIPLYSFECIRYPNGILNFNSSFIGIPIENLQLTRIKKVIKLFNNYADNSQAVITNLTSPNIDYPSSIKELGYNEDDGEYFKVFKLYQPDIFTQTLIKSIYLNNYYLTTYIYKSTNYVARDAYIILMRIYGGFTIIFLYTFIIWIVEVVIMTIVLHKVTISLTTPIDTLTIHVRSIGQDRVNHVTGKKKFDREKENTSLSELDKLSYPDDDDVNELFEICKSMVKGGFSEEKKFAKKDSLTIAENYINQIKVNNIVVDENFIEHYGLASSNHIFSYKGNELEEQMKMIKYDKDHKEYVKKISKVNSNIRKMTKILFKKSTHKKLKGTIGMFGDTGNNNSIWKIKQQITSSTQLSLSSLIAELAFKHIFHVDNNTLEEAAKNKELKENDKEKEKNKMTQKTSLIDIHNKVRKKFDRDIYSVKL